MKKILIKKKETIFWVLENMVIRICYINKMSSFFTGPAVLSSRRRLTVDEWVKVVASKSGQEGTLIVNDEEPVKGEITLSVDL